MSQVTFIIKLLVDGKEKIVEAKTDVSKLADEFEKAKSGATKFRDKLLEFNQTAQSFQNLASGLQQLSGAFGQFTQAYADQEAAETRLANNMRNTMDAREEDIQSIKDLCAAQQQLGVIGDEVQLAGAQELATYLTMKDGLQTLIPVMNDMLAQQYGLNATQEQAQTIASMLGKVMDGQVGALSRYGYKFDEAQEQVLKFGTEQQRVAVLAEVVSSAVGGSNEALAATPSGQIKQAANNFGDLKEKIGAVTVHLQSYLNVFAQIGMAASGFTNLASGAAGALRAIRDLTAGTRALAAAQGAARTITLGFAATTRVLTAAMRGATIGATTLKVAIRGLMAATGVGLAIAALTWALEKLFFSSDEAADGLDGVSDASQRLQQAQEAMTGTYSRAVAEIEGEKQKLQELMKAKADTSGAVQELNNKYGASFGYYKTAKEWYDALIAKSEDYCMQLAYEAQARVLMEQKAANQIKLREILEKRRQMRENGTDKEKYSTTVMTNLGATIGGGHTATRYTKEYNDLNTAGWALVNENNEINQKLKFAADERNKHLKNLGSPTAPPKPTGGKGTPQTVYDKGSLGYIDQELEKLRKKRIAVTVDADRLALDEQIADLEREKLELEFRPKMEGWQELDKELRAKGISLEGKEAQPIGVPVVLKPADVQRQMDWMPKAKPLDTSTPDYKRSRYDFLGQQAQRVQQDFEIGIIGENEALRAIEDINAALRGLGLNEIEIPLQTENVDKAKKKFEGATDAVGQMGQSLAGLGSALELPELNIAGTIAQAIATMAQGYAQASAQASALGPWGWIAFAATGLAQLTAMIASVKQATAFAQGGIVSGPTMALVGEYAGASNNPEVIAPLDKLRSMIGPQEGISGRVVFKIEGRSLRGVLEREQHHLARS